MEISRHWRLKAQRYRLEGTACQICGRVTFPPRPVCPACTIQPVWITIDDFFAFRSSNRTVESKSFIERVR